MLRRWNDYWFTPAPLFDLAIVRLIVVGAQVLLLIFHTGYLVKDLEYLAGLPSELYFPLPVLRLLTLPLGADYRPSFDLLMGARIVGIIMGALAFVGLFTRTSLVALALTTTILIAHRYSYGDVHHPEAPLIIALLALAASPAGAILSVDAWRRRRRGPKNVELGLGQESVLAGWPIKLLQWQFVLIYLSAALSKVIFHGGPGWINGYTLQYYFIFSSLDEGGRPLGLLISQYHYPVLLAQIVVILFQSTFALAVVFPRLLWIYVPVGLGFHVANIVLLNAPFPEWLALYSVFVPWRRCLDLVSTHRAVAARDTPA